MLKFFGCSKPKTQNPKYETRNTKQIRMTKNTNSKQYDLEDRTLDFAKRVDTKNEREIEEDRTYLIFEATELTNIFGAILQKSK